MTKPSSNHLWRTLHLAIGIALLGAPACSPGPAAAVGSKTPVTQLQSGSIADRALPGPLAWSIRALVEGSDAALGNLTDADREALRGSTSETTTIRCGVTPVVDPAVTHAPRSVSLGTRPMRDWILMIITRASLVL